LPRAIDAGRRSTPKREASPRNSTHQERDALNKSNRRARGLVAYELLNAAVRLALVDEQLRRAEHVAAQELGRARATAARSATLLTQVTFERAVTLAGLANLGTQTLALGTSLESQALALLALVRAGFALSEASLDASLAGGFALFALFCFCLLLGRAPTPAHFATGSLELGFQYLAGDFDEASDQPIYQTTTLTIDRIHHAFFSSLTAGPP
jgi:hypothetical protein